MALKFEDIIKIIKDIDKRLRVMETVPVNRNVARSTDPSDPPNDEFVIWQSDGTASGDDGDIMIKITDSNGTTKTTTLVDYSAV